MATSQEDSGEHNDSLPQTRPVSYSLVEGYEVTFVEKPPKEIQVECSICLQVLSDPCLLDCKCGYSFCRSCIEPIRAKGSPCPLCSTKFSIVLPNLRLDRALKDMSIHCPNKELGCEWENERRLLTDHLNTTPVAKNRLNGCDYIIIKCVLCSYSCKRREMAHHESSQCPERQYTCEYCKLYTSTYKNVYTNHWPSCGPFARAVERGAILSTSDTTSTLPDVGGASTSVVDNCTPGQTTENPLGIKEEQLELLLKMKPTKARTTAPDTPEDPRNCMALPIEGGHTGSENIEKETIKGQQLPVTMDNFSSFTTVWYSQPFYTHMKGYRMCLSVQPYSKTDNRYMSVYTHLMRGDHDKELTWPLQGEVTVKLVDQVSGRSHSRTIEYRKEVGEDSAGRVKQEGQRSVGIGKQKFIARRNLKPNFLQNDSLWFNVQCEVDM